MFAGEMPVPVSVTRILTKASSGSSLGRLASGCQFGRFDAQLEQFPPQAARELVQPVWVEVRCLNIYD